MRDREPDDELGDLLESTFRSYAGEAPQAHHGELAATARRRVRNRRRSLVTTAAAAVVFVVIGGVWNAIGPGYDGGSAADSAAGEAASGATRDGGSSTPDLTSGSHPTRLQPLLARWVTYRGVQVSVPDGWTIGVANRPWCSSQGDLATAGASRNKGEVGVPGPVPDVVCPQEAPPVSELRQHVWMTPSTAKPGRQTRQLGDGWTRDIVVIGGVRVEVQTHKDPELRRELLAAIRIV